MEKKVASEKAVLALAAIVATLLMVLPFGGAAVPAATTATGLLGSNYCTRSCGNISIPYPFGVEPGCYHAAWFNLTCDDSYQPPKLFLGDGTMQVLDISVENSTVRINSTAMQLQYNRSSGPGTTNGTWGLGLPETGPYFLSESASMLEAIGCGTQVSILGGPHHSLVSSCSAICPIILSRDGSSHATIVEGYSSYTIQIDPISSASGWHLPTSVYIVDQSYNYSWNGGEHPEALPATLDWIISRSNSSACPTNNTTTAPECVSNHSYCRKSSSFVHGGYTCQCAHG